jgi:hypothetical protein
MSKKSSESPSIYCVRYGSNLVGEMAADRERIAEIKEGERVRVDVRTGRVPSRLRFYWAFLREVVKATGAAPHEKALHQIIKLRTGFTDDVIMGGYVIKVPSSVAFDAMDETTFSTFLNEALAFIAKEFGVTPEQAGVAA